MLVITKRGKILDPERAPIWELPDRNFKITVMSILKDIVDRRDNMNSGEF